MAWFRRHRSPFRHEIDRFHVDGERAAAATTRLVTGTSEAAREGKRSSDLTVAALGSAPIDAEDIPVQNLDLFATGTLQEKSKDGDGAAPGLDEQPFPAEVPEFRLVHVANGRAMIEDDAGLWVVQPGSLLPDSSYVQ